MSLNLRQVFEAPKSFAAPPSWAKNSNDLSLLVPLDLQGVTVEGLFLRGSGKAYQPDAAMMLQLEVHRAGKRSGGQMERVCWRPISGHTNPNRGPSELRMMEIRGSHYHDFYLNIGADDKEMLGGNLKVARAIDPDPLTYKDFIDFCAVRFNIVDLISPPVPPWEADLFGNFT